MMGLSASITPVLTGKIMIIISTFHQTKVFWNVLAMEIHWGGGITKLIKRWLKN
jgi:hypothetical protein